MRNTFDPDWTGKKTGEYGQDWLDVKGPENRGIQVNERDKEPAIYDAYERRVIIHRRVGF